MKNNIFVLYGGKSVEHEVSLKSATAIINSINKKEYNIYPVYITHDGIWITGDPITDPVEKVEDLIMESNLNLESSISNFLSILSRLDKKIIFPALHGPNGEDGTIQGFLEILDLPYIGCGVLSSALAMDKAVSRDLFKAHNIPQAKYLYFTREEWKKSQLEIKNNIKDKISYPVYVKPANSGSSVGISQVKTSSEIEEAIDYALKYDNKIIIEEELIAREMQISVIGNNHPLVSLPGEFIMERDFFDYEAKYIENTIIPVVPAKLDPETTEELRKLAAKTYRVLNCKGLTRIDIFVDDKNNFFVNEANTLPGFTPVSMTPVLWKATDNTSYSALVEKLINYAEKDYMEKQRIINKR